jgi:hypothetical protein
MKRCIIVQGPTYDNSINQIKECWKGFDVIWSTWKGYEAHYTENEKVIFSHLPHNNGVNNLNYQKESTLAGLKLAKELGYERALKWRSDMWTNNAKGLIELFIEGHYNTLCWVESEGGYFADFYMEDTVDNLLQLWDIEPNGSFPERVLTDRIKSLEWMDRINLIVSELTPDVDVYWNTRHGAYWMNVLKEKEQLYKNNKTWRTN